MSSLQGKLQTLAKLHKKKIAEVDAMKEKLQQLEKKLRAKVGRAILWFRWSNRRARTLRDCSGKGGVGAAYPVNTQAETPASPTLLVSPASG